MVSPEFPLCKAAGLRVINEYDSTKKSYAYVIDAVEVERWLAGVPFVTALILAFFTVFGLWKLGEIIYWLCTHIHIGRGVEEMNLTQIIIASIVVITLVIDVLLLCFRGVNQTISRQLYMLSKDWPVVAFLIGFAMGHIFWSNCG